MAVWVVRAGRGAEVVEKVESAGVIAIGWTDMGDCSALASREEFKERYQQAYPDDTSPTRAAGQAGQMYRFAREIAHDDIVMTPDSPAREVLIGRVTGDCRHEPSVIDGYPHTRPVEWLRTVSRDDLSPSLRNVIGGALTLFAVEGFDEEVQRLLEGVPARGTGDDTGTDQPSLYEDTVAKADELVSDILAGIGPYEFQDLVAALLRAMGLRTEVSAPGPDRGTDVVAHPDAFGFQQPCIRVQVKHTKGAVGAPELRSFRSAIGPEEKGLFISTGGFTRDALLEPDRAGPPLTLMDRDKFVDLLTEHYEKLEPEFQAMVPLKKVYIPVTLS